MKTDNEVVQLVNVSRVRATFAVVTFLSCGLGLVPWIIWEIVRKK